MAITYRKTQTASGVITTSNGNKKLMPTAKVKYIIWNLPAVKTCPYATEHCKSACYALKSERAYPSARACRSANFEASQGLYFASDMINHINKYLGLKSYKNASKIVVRIHESGDFYSPEYFNNWLAIAEAFKGDPRVVFVAYTKSLPYIHDVPNNMVVRSSIWDDTSEEMLIMTQEKNFPIYTAVESFTNESAREKCECLNCSTCFKCFNAKFELLKCEIH